MVTSVSDAKIKNIKAVLSGQADIVDNFLAANNVAWQKAGSTWLDKSKYQLDGYTFVLNFDLLDGKSIAICAEQGLGGDFSCFSITIDTT